MSNDLNSGVREALAALTDVPPPAGLAAAAIRTARRQRRIRIAVTSVAVVAALAAAPLAVSAVPLPGVGGSISPAGQAMQPLVVTAYTGDWNGSLLLDRAEGEYVELPYRVVVPSPDGARALVYTGENSLAEPLRLGVMDTSTAEVRWMEDYRGNGNVSTGGWSRDGRQLLITERYGSEAPPGGFAIVDADTLASTFVEHADVADPAVNSMGLRYVWAPGGNEIALTQSTAADHESEADQVSGIRFYDRGGRLLRTVPASAPLVSEAWFSPDGTRMALFHHESGGAIQIADPATGAVIETVSIPGWDADSWGDLVGWADEDHLLVREGFRMWVIDLDGRFRQEVNLVGRGEPRIGSSDGLTQDAAELTFGAR